jgi:hypothetical protein
MVKKTAGIGVGTQCKAASRDLARRQHVCGGDASGTRRRVPAGIGLGTYGIGMVRKTAGIGVGAQCKAACRDLASRQHGAGGDASGSNTMI